MTGWPSAGLSLSAMMRQIVSLALPGPNTATIVIGRDGTNRRTEQCSRGGHESESKPFHGIIPPWVVQFVIIGLPDCFPHAFGWRIAGLHGRCSHVTRCCGRGEDKPNLCISGFGTKRRIKF